MIGLAPKGSSIQEQVNNYENKNTQTYKASGSISLYYFLRVCVALIKICVLHRHSLAYQYMSFRSPLQQTFAQSHRAHINVGLVFHLGIKICIDDVLT